MIGGFGCFLGFLALPDRALLGRIHPRCLGTVIGLRKVTTMKEKKILGQMGLKFFRNIL